MPTPALLNSMWQVKIVGRVEGQQTNNIFHFSCVGASSDVLVHLVQVFAQCFIDNLLPVLSSSWTLEKFTYQQVSAPISPSFDYVPAGVLAGAGNAAALPSYSSCVVSIHTPLGGKSRRGRFYLPGVPENQTVNSKLDTALPFYIAAVAFVACFAAYFFHPEPAERTLLFDLGVYARQVGGTHFPFTNAGFTGANEFVVQSVLGTTRSRKLGIGA